MCACPIFLIVENTKAVHTGVWTLNPSAKPQMLLPTKLKCDHMMAFS